MAVTVVRKFSVLYKGKSCQVLLIVQDPDGGLVYGCTDGTQLFTVRHEEFVKSSGAGYIQHL